MTLFIYTLFFLFSNNTISDDFIWDGDAGDGLWMTAENWDNNILPALDGDVVIDDVFTVTLNSSSYSVESINLSGGANLIIPEGNTLNTSKGGAIGSDGIHLAGEAAKITSLHIYGSLNVSMADAPGQAVDINAYSMVHVHSTGLLNILESGSHGIEVTEKLINEGTINISNTSSSGIKTKGTAMTSGIVHNMAGGQVNFTNIPGKAINMVGSISFINDGEINIIGEDDVVFYSDDETLFNNGVFNSSGIINANLFENGTGSTVAVSGPVGTLGFDGATTFPNNILSITIDGNTPGINCDQVQQIDGMMSLENTTLELLGSYVPQVADTFLIINTHSPDSSSLTGHFLDLPQSASLTFNGINLYISYHAGDGNDVLLLSNPPGSTDLDGDGFYSHVDCDDLNADAFPGAIEIPNNDIDENCDDYIAMDQDFDGFFDDVDCDDTDPDINPDATEIPNNDVDENCDNNILIIDDDMDGVNSDEDCDDNNADIYPGATEIPNNDIDENCDEYFAMDIDLDGFFDDVDCDDENPDINPNAEEIPNNDVDENCDGEALIIDNDLDGFNSDDDCDDNDENVYPGATEIPNNDIDENCDEYFAMDVDLDGYFDDVDCDDENPDINSAAVEIPNNGIDEDCDGEDQIVSNNNISKLTIEVFPNPTNGDLVVELPSAINADLELRDFSGKIISKQSFSGTTTIDLSGCSNGVYLLLVKTEKETWVEGIVKM